MLHVLLFIFLMTIAYLSGSVCSAVIVSRLFSLPDPRQQGSKNPGATNVLRLSGKKYGIIVLVTDMLKGFIPMMIAHLFGASETMLGFTALAAVVGHMYPVFFKFHGGKGVATAIGALLGLHFIAGVAVIIIWVLIAHFTGYVSLASLLSLLAAPLLAIMGRGHLDCFIPLLIMVMLIVYKHRDNITRLIDGEEPKISNLRGNLDKVVDACTDKDSTSNTL